MQSRPTRHHPTSTNITRRSCRQPAVPTIKILAGVLPGAQHQQTHCNPQANMPSPGGQISGMASYENRCGWVGPGGAGYDILSTSLEGYYTATRGQSRITHVPVSSRAAPGLPCSRAVPDRRDAIRVPACKICDPAATVRSLSEGPTPELLTQNQVLGEQTHSRSEPGLKIP